MTKHARGIWHYDRTRAGHEALWSNKRGAWGMTEHAQVMRHYYRTRAGYEALQNTRGHEALLQKTCRHEVLRPNTHRSWGIIAEHGQVMRHYDRTRAGHTALLLEHRALHIPKHFVSSDVRTYDAYTYPLGNRRSYFRNKLQHKQHQPLERTLPGSVSHRPASHSAR